MKKLISFICIFASLLFVLSACAVDTTKPSVPDESKLVDWAEGDEQYERDNVSKQNQIYFATGNDYYDLYIGYTRIPIEITLLSRDYIDPNNIQVLADIKADYSVVVTEQETGVSLASYEIIESEGTRNAYLVSANVHDFPLYLYQTYKGMDWADVGKKYVEYLDLAEKYNAGEIEVEQVDDARDRYNYAATMYINEYTNLNVDDIPRFYEYLIQIKINDAEVEETLTTVQVSVDDTVYDVNIGNVYIRPFCELKGGYGAYEYFPMKSSSPFWLNSFPYGSGIEECQSAIHYAKESLTLTGLHFLEDTTSSVTILDIAAVILDDPYSTDGIVFEWDGITPIYVEQGKCVTLYITFQDNRMKEINYHSKLYPVFEFECDNSAYEIITEIPLYRYYTDKWLLCTIGLDGLNMESYFNDYYYLSPAENWRYDVDLTPWGQEE